MSYYLGWPSDLQISNISVVGAVANVIASTTAIAAPGVGFRIRLWAFAFSHADLSQIPGRWYSDLTDDPATISYTRLAGNGFGAGFTWWPGGLALAANLGVLFRHGVNSGMPVLGAGTVYYTTEPIT